ncbi:MAG: hypothetical protein DMG65_02305 [Candidatus Angelobacter sp. Gp1-AA117]|nr:MAG: hypothetical protein DMG65_02305 [Candidatus Angelobacter sp. Gp1-AA117]
MNYRVTISETDQTLQLDPHDLEGPLSVGDVIEWGSTLDSATCQVGNFFPPHCFAPKTLTIGPGGRAYALLLALPTSFQKITYWCTPTAPQVAQPGTQQDTESYDPGQGIIIVDPPLPGDDDHKDKHKHKKQEREAVIG